MTIGHPHAVKLPIRLPEPEIATFCEKWHVAEIAFFGSVLGPAFRNDSDLNVLLTFDAGSHVGLFDVAQMELELKELFHRDVMILTRRGVELSSNAIRRAKILSTAEVVYARR